MDENHGGTTEIESSPGVGTRVTVALASTPPPRAHRTSIKSVAPVAGRTVLVVDDEVLLRRIAVRLLERQGFGTLTAEHGEAAVETFRRHRHVVDLVLLDLTMPVMDGPEAFHRLRALDGDLRVLICTGHHDDPRVETLIGQGAIGLLQKPYSRTALDKAVQHALR